MKTLVIPSSLDLINKLKCDGVIIGIRNLSINLPCYFDVCDIKKIDKDVFVCLNKNIHNSELELLEKTLIELSSYDIKGIIFYDLAVVNIVKRLNLDFELIWNQEHMTNNYYTINFWNEMGVKTTWVSNDITLREMKEIKENTSSKLMVTLFGYVPMMTSRRHLVKNYLNTFNLDDESLVHYIEKEDSVYPLVDEEHGTTCYTSFILNGLKEKILLDYDYIVLNSFLISDEDFVKVVDIFNEVNSDNVDLLEDEINTMFNNIKKGFFYEETVYKVK